MAHDVKMRIGEGFLTAHAGRKAQLNPVPVDVYKRQEYYHQVKAFGIWSLPKKDSPMENWIEEQLDKAVEFYRKEIDVRNWYGMFNYGDVMHTYDKARHCWRYDTVSYTHLTD